MRQFRAAHLLWLLDVAFALVAARGTAMVADHWTQLSAAAVPCVEAGLSQPFALETAANICLAADSPVHLSLPSLALPEAGTVIAAAADRLGLPRFR